MPRICRHPVMIVEEFTEMGAFVQCCFCKVSFHMEETEICAHYIPAQYYSGSEGPRGDKTFLISSTLLGD